MLFYNNLIWFILFHIKLLNIKIRKLNIINVYLQVKNRLIFNGSKLGVNAGAESGLKIDKYLKAEIYKKIIVHLEVENRLKYNGSKLGVNAGAESGL